ncbi:MAG: glycoside-pentoside-hexuronide (GPH):cation symporter [Oscillospiraceae bacterium]|nr:glycoside-pentoside-hexuronide (GPH):cation symporter [Oscillospiraceae bacterium]
MDNNFTRNRFCFGLGTVGRDMFYALVSMYIMVFITVALGVDDTTLAIMTTMIFILRLVDAFSDPLMGLVVDNTKTRWGKFKPWILIGAVVAAMMMVLQFADLGLTGVAFIVVFGAIFFVWDVAFGLNDVAYWSMMPSLSTDQKIREKIGSFARICASIGLFAVVVGVLPITNALGDAFGNLAHGWFVFAIIISVLMLAFQSITLIGVKEPKGVFQKQKSTSILEMFRVIIKNDQLLWVAISLSLFMIGYMTTTIFGVHFFRYAYGDEDVYMIFAAVLGVSQLTAFVAFPFVSKFIKRRMLYTCATISVVVGYILFFFSPMNMIFIGAAGVLIFVGQAFIQVLMLMFLSDSIEYGQWKLGKRNESITFSLQPFINKIGGAVANGVLGLTLIISGINAAETAADVTPGGITIMKVAMLLLPLGAIVVGYVINMLKFKIDEKKFAEIVADLKARGEIVDAG